MRRFLAVLVAIVLVMCTPAMAGEWQWSWEGTETNFECHYLKDNGQYATSEYLTIDGETYYFDCTGSLLTDNYAPDGNWINIYGNIDSEIPKRYAKANEMPKYEKYTYYDGWEDISSTITVTYYDIYTEPIIGYVEIITTTPSNTTMNQYYMKTIDNGTFALIDMDTEACRYYMVSDESGSVIRLSYESITWHYYKAD